MKSRYAVRGGAARARIACSAFWRAVRAGAARPRVACFVLPALSLIVALPLAAQDRPARRVSWSGDFRIGYFDRHLDRPDGSSLDEDRLRARLRYGARIVAADALSLKVRVAGQFGTDQQGTRFFVRPHASGPGGLAPGDITLDEAYAELRPDPRWWIRLGRLQTNFKLPGVAGKSLDRNDSSNTGVGWTDGLHARYERPGGWGLDLIAQHRPREGPSNAIRPPLESASGFGRVLLFAGLSDTNRRGRLVHRAIGVSYLPDAFPRADESGREDYLAVVARLAAAWPAPAIPGEVMIAGGAGYAPDVPEAPGGGSTGRVAWQASVNLLEFVPSHRFGIVYGTAGAGWLISKDYRPDERLLEGRYQWRIRDFVSMEARLRHRRQPVSAPDTAEELDGYVRFSFRL